MKLRIISTLAISFLLLSLSGCDESPVEKAKDVDRAAINWCWENVNMSPGDELTRKYIADDCEEMIANFKAAYGVAP